MSERPRDPARYAVVWAQGRDIYAHSGPDGRTVIYPRSALDAVVGLSDERVLDMIESLDTLRAAPLTLFAVPAEDLDRLLGLS